MNVLPLCLLLLLLLLSVFTRCTRVAHSLRVCRVEKQGKYINGFLFYTLMDSHFGYQNTSSWRKTWKGAEGRQHIGKLIPIRRSYWGRGTNVSNRMDMLCCKEQDKVKTVMSEDGKDNVTDGVTSSCEGLKREYLTRLLSGEETIYALSSGNVISAIAVIRLSGILSKIILEILLHNNSTRNPLHFVKNKKGSTKMYLGQEMKMKKKSEYSLSEIIVLRRNIETRKLHMGKLYDNNSNIIDNILYSFFKGPKSYTGEDVVEIYCHGNPLIVKEIMSEIDSLNEVFHRIVEEEKDKYHYNKNYYYYYDYHDRGRDSQHSGENDRDLHRAREKESYPFDMLHNQNCFIKVREGKRGEFTRRAFKNRKMTLLQVEGLRELLFCKQKIQKKIALNYINGYAKSVYVKLRKNIKELLVYSQLKIDFEEEHITAQEERRSINHFFKAKLQDVIKNVKEIIKKENVEDLSAPSDVLLFGNVNAGKSTLMNCICNSRVSIVTNIGGTTIDVVQKSVNIGGNYYNFCDSAGIIQKERIVLIPPRPNDASPDEVLTPGRGLKTWDTHIEKNMQSDSHKRLERIGIRKTLRYLKTCTAAIVLLDIRNYVDELTNIIYTLNDNFPQGRGISQKERKMCKTGKTRKARTPEEADATSTRGEGKKVPALFLCINKCDLEEGKEFPKIKSDVRKMMKTNLYGHILKRFSKKVFFLSSKNRCNVDKLLAHFNRRMTGKLVIVATGEHEHEHEKRVCGGKRKSSASSLPLFLPFERHKLHLKEALNHLLFIKRRGNVLSFDIVSEEIGLAARALRRIIGRVSGEKILEQLLGSFCIGK
ncbi:GTPase, putative [Plasmodium ovale curtisi]|uniref:GTPase, putative n=1 Tax=Plasmodium ovale curtisi TaxID=864141 RepID=A0A1A8WHA7_PLAOA|nr:GTPase, putative [Plasmodium ovale curtisi]